MSADSGSLPWWWTAQASAVDGSPGKLLLSGVSCPGSAPRGHRRHPRGFPVPTEACSCDPGHPGEAVAPLAFLPPPPRPPFPLPQRGGLPERRPLSLATAGALAQCWALGRQKWRPSPGHTRRPLGSKPKRAGLGLGQVLPEPAGPCSPWGRGGRRVSQITGTGGRAEGSARPAPVLSPGRPRASRICMWLPCWTQGWAWAGGLARGALALPSRSASRREHAVPPGLWLGQEACMGRRVP